jgi:hypothetical protein
LAAIGQVCVWHSYKRSTVCVKVGNTGRTPHTHNRISLSPLFFSLEQALDHRLPRVVQQQLRAFSSSDDGLRVV